MTPLAPVADADVPRFVRELGLPGLVDLHVHFMPKPVLDKVWAYFDAAGPLVGREWPIRYREEEERRLARLREMQVLAFPSLVYAHKPGMAEWLNAWARDFAARHHDVVSTATFFPEPHVERYVAAALEHGARLFKVHVQVGDFDPGDPLLDQAWGLLADAGTPVVVHCGGGPVPGRFTGPEPMSRVLARHPRLTAVVAHMGMPEYSEFLDLVERYERVHVDTTMAFTDFAEASAPFPRPELARLRALGERVVLGTDFPNLPYPYAHQIAALVRLDLGEQWLRGVLLDNALRLLPTLPDPGKTSISGSEPGK